MRFVVVFLCLLAFVLPAQALDSEVEAQATQLYKQLKCVVCEGQSLSESTAPLAIDMRRMIQQRLVQGEAPQQVLDYLTARYGQEILLRPPVEPLTWPLWGAPILLFVLGTGSLIVMLRGGQKPKKQLKKSGRSIN